MLKYTYILNDIVELLNVFHVLQDGIQWLLL